MPSRLACLVVGLLLATGGAGCSGDQPPDPARMTVNDGATPIAPGQQNGLTSGFDRSTHQLAGTFPLEALRQRFTEVTTMAADQLVPSEATGCNPDEVTTPAIPASEALATKPPESGDHEAEVAHIVGARATTEAHATAVMAAIKKAAADCATFSSPLRDLGEGSIAPAEKGTATLTEASHEDWTGVRISTTVTLTGKSWSEQVTRESLVLRRGQVILLVQVSAPSGAAELVDSLVEPTLEQIDELA